MSALVIPVILETLDYTGELYFGGFHHSVSHITL